MPKKLPGGNMNAVYRDGNTVTRQAGEWTPTVHRYLRYLARAGVEQIPVPIGTEGERERLRYVEGDVPVYPLPEWVWSQELLRDGALKLREIHDASVGFSLDGALWQSPSKVPAEVICHNDFSPHNFTFTGGKLSGVIDFDMCSPGPRLWDLAYFATRAVPLTGSTPTNAPDFSQARRRTQVILDAYGSAASWDDLLRVAVIRLWDLADFSRVKAVELQNTDLLADADYYENDARFLTAVRCQDRS